MFIEVQETPNQDTLKFIPGAQVISDKSLSFKRTDNRIPSLLVRNLFTIDGVEEVLLGSDFISVQKGHELSWNEIKTLVIAEIMDFFMSGMNVVDEDMIAAMKHAKDENTAPLAEGEEDEIIKEIKELLETRVRPAVEQDGGNIEFKRFDRANGILYLTLQGACSGCPSASITLKDGIERMMQHFIPEIKSVEAE